MIAGLHEAGDRNELGGLPARHSESGDSVLE
jgi:hypothetical protein